MRPTIQAVQQYWDDRPCNFFHSNKPLATREYFDEVEAKKFRTEPHIPDFCEFERWRGKRVLEIGCGIGTMATNFARHGADYTGVELSANSLDLARKRFDVYGLPGKFLLANAENLTDVLEPDSYDLVFSWGVIHHSPSPRAIIRNIDHYVSPGSTVKIMVYATNSWKNFMIQAGIDQPEAQAGCPIADTFTASELCDLMGPGYAVRDMHQDHIFSFQIEPYRSGEFQQQPWFQAMPPGMFQALERNLGWHLMMTAERL
jgi:2-polyprenyl-3-methyl-5-hydroxy-6-metoxy-1,4-benzoquinol methylase